MDVVGVTAACLPVVRVCTALSREALHINIFKYFIIILIVSTHYIFVHLLDNEVFECTIFILQIHLFFNPYMLRCYRPSAGNHSG